MPGAFHTSLKQTGCMGKTAAPIDAQDVHKACRSEIAALYSLADTLKRISEYGAQEFYTGETVELIVEEMKNTAVWSPCRI